MIEVLGVLDKKSIRKLFICQDSSSLNKLSIASARGKGEDELKKPFRFQQGRNCRVHSKLHQTQTAKQSGFFFLKISKDIGKAWRTSLTRTKRASLREPQNVSPQSRSPFSASFQTFCLTAHAYQNTQKYGLKQRDPRNDAGQLSPCNVYTRTGIQSARRSLQTS